MRPQSCQVSICRGGTVAGTPAIAAPGASYAVDFPRLMKNPELLPPAAADSSAGKIDEHREDESQRLRRQAVHGNGAAPVPGLCLGEAGVGVQKGREGRRTSFIGHDRSRHLG
jgi:hypothetical protein